MVPSLKDAEWLAWMERLVGDSALHARSAEFSRESFYCRLNEQPDHLVPQHCLQEPGGKPHAPLVLNPSFAFHADENLRPQIASELLDKFADTGQLIWVTDPRTEAAQPFWLDEEFGRWTAEIRAGQVGSGEIPLHIRRVLQRAGVLVRPEELSSDRKRWQQAISPASRQFCGKGYATVRGLIHPFHISALRRYYRYLIRNGMLELGDGQSSRRYVSYNDPVARFFHAQLANAVGDIVGEAVKPSYVYLASYQEGAQLPRHTDREQCEFSVSFCLDYFPEPSLATPWPLHLDTDTGTTTVFQALGDALVYRGRKLPHYRHVLPAGHTSTSIFFHYVRLDFAGPLE